jgi:multidrug efflux pump subunit AcrA (membrane-fusion protein)
VFSVGARNVVRRVRIRLGSADGDWLEVLEGLQAGDAVVARGAGFLGDGDTVRVVAEKATP